MTTQPATYVEPAFGIARCPLCGTGLNPVPARNALSRIDNHTYICNQCGMTEALKFRLPAADQPRECLYFEPVTRQIALVTENESGFYPLFPKPVEDEAWLNQYVSTANGKLGYDDETVNAIVLSSMFR
ncbi:hypothetical protein [Mycolicibacterium mageritense]|uniref:hypothetical protein n=1 Tax=Mycolicibacterium mageritense TaxID=53462 RepID=UPI001E2DA428|nr:hypothetical protein [Mycolicibacterium mageritense]MCC9181107.1 hypothetical protein [Mycolicibacterium mageritense]